MPKLTLPEYAALLCDALRSYDFPAVTCEFMTDGNLKPCRHDSMLEVESHIGSLLRSADRAKIKDGLSNVLYWGWARKPMLGKHKVEKFRRARGIRNADDRRAAGRHVTTDMIQRFASVVESMRSAHTCASPTTRAADLLLAIKNVRLPQFSRMSFTTKITMFLNPACYPVLDLKIARAINSCKSSPLPNLRISGTSISITRDNAAAYENWARWCQEIARKINDELKCPCRELRAVDVERAIFTLANDPGRQDELCDLLEGPDA